MAGNRKQTIKQANQALFRFATKFLNLEASSGIFLLLAAVVALCLANGFPVLFMPPPALTHWVNDGLMVLFFLLVGLEIKRELIEGELSSRAKAMLPCAAALGGVVFPAILYFGWNGGTDAMRGWAIPTATDIAFSLGILSLFGRRVPVALKIFLMALAVIDDLIAVLIIAVFYTQHIDTRALLIAAGCVAGLFACNRNGVIRLIPYAVLGVVLWLAVLKSGVHATVAGVILGCFIPMPLGKKLINTLHPWIAFGVMPIFAFANAGVSLDGFGTGLWDDPIAMGIAAGLVIGKPLGITVVVLLLQLLKIAPMPKGTHILHVLGVGCLAGIGFTMSLFIGGLAFSDPTKLVSMKIGIIVGSAISAMVGSLFMWFAIRWRPVEAS